MVLTLFSLPSLRPRREMQSSLHSSTACRGGLAGNQTLPCRGAGQQAGRGEDPTSCSMVYSTVKAAFLFHLHLLLSSHAFCNSITTHLWRGTMVWRGPKFLLSSTSNGLVSREQWSGTSAAATPVSATRLFVMRLSASYPLSLSLPVLGCPCPWTGSPTYRPVTITTRCWWWSTA